MCFENSASIDIILADIKTNTGELLRHRLDSNYHVTAFLKNLEKTTTKRQNKSN